MSIKVFLENSNCGGKTHTECGLHHSMGWCAGQNKKGQVGETDGSEVGCRCPALVEDPGSAPSTHIRQF